MSRDFFLTLLNLRVRMYVGHFAGHPTYPQNWSSMGFDVMGSLHGPLVAARWYQRHGKVVPKPSAPT